MQKTNIVKKFLLLLALSFLFEDSLTVFTQPAGKADELFYLIRVAQRSHSFNFAGARSRTIRPNSCANSFALSTAGKS
jgi:hypothetical protein